MPTQNTIIKAVCSAFEITHKQLLSPSHKRHLFYARVIAAHMLHTHLDLSSTRIGVILNRDHASVLYYYKTFDIWIERAWLHQEPLAFFVKVDDYLDT